MSVIVQHSAPFRGSLGHFLAKQDGSTDRLFDTGRRRIAEESPPQARRGASAGTSSTTATPTASGTRTGWTTAGAPPTTRSGSGWTIFVDYDGDGVKDANEPDDVTDPNGYYRITGVNAGTWDVVEVMQAGWVRTTAEWVVTLMSGEAETNVLFGNFQGNLVMSGDTATGRLLEGVQRPAPDQEAQRRGEHQRHHHIRPRQLASSQLPRDVRLGPWVEQSRGQDERPDRVVLLFAGQQQRPDRVGSPPAHQRPRGTASSGTVTVRRSSRWRRWCSSASTRPAGSCDRSPNAAPPLTGPALGPARMIPDHVPAFGLAQGLNTDGSVSEGDHLEVLKRPR
jgi:hypothetical protein